MGINKTHFTMSRSEYTQTTVSDLDAAGEKVNFLYYDTKSVRINAVEVDTLKKYRQGLTSLSMGGTSQITVPSSDSISDTYLYLELPPILDTNVVLQEAWGYAAIKSINYTIGSSSISTVELSSESLFSHAMLCAETSEKRQSVLQLAGASLGTADDRAVGPKACISLALPWSTIRKSGKLGYDASLLSDPIIIQITLNDANHFMSTITGGGTPSYPAAYVKGECILKQGVLSNKADSMKSTLANNSNLLVSYPFVHKQTGTNSLILNAQPGESQEVKIQSLINSDLLGLSFMVTPAASKRSGAAGVMANKYDTINCEDIKVTFNGQVLIDAPWRMSELQTLNLDVGGTDTPKTVMNSTGVAFPEGAYKIYYLPFSYMKTVIFEGQYSNVSRYSQQNMEILFTPKHTVAQNLQFTCSYYYNALCTTQSGATRITFA